jgi:WD40 repeat protein
LNGQVQGALAGHTEQIRGVCFSTDGRYIISGSTDSTVKMWNVKTHDVDCSFACLSRLCAMDSCTIDFKLRIACGDGSGALYILSPVGLISKDGQ